jgi:hypothetical protein
VPVPPEGAHGPYEIERQNCAWEATHARNPDGTWSEVELDGEEQEARVKACLEAKGWTVKEEEGGFLWWD